MRASRNEYVGVLAAIASSALGGVAGGTTRFAIGSSDPLTLGVFRFGVGFLLLLPIALALRIKWRRRRAWRHVFCVLHRAVQSGVSLHDRGAGLTCALDFAVDDHAPGLASRRSIFAKASA